MKSNKYLERRCWVIFSQHWGRWNFWRRLHCFLFGFLHLNVGEIVDSSKLNKSRKHKSKADSYEPIHGSRIGHFGQRMSGTDAQGGHREDCGYPFSAKEQKDTAYYCYFYKRTTNPKGKGEMKFTKLLLCETHHL